MSAPPRHLSVVICTYERPALLARALASVGALRGLGRHGLDVVVVDNSDLGSARATVDAAAARSPVPIRYVEAHPPNISVARNAGVAATEAEIVAFLDDDQELAPGWLEAVATALATSPHDVFFGPISPRFEDERAASSAARAMFTRHSSAPLGAELLAYGRAPGQVFALSTANSIFRRDRTLAEPAPFDPAFGQCGGEDFHLLCRLQRSGRRFGWIPDAAASDFVPRHRCRPSYLLRRHYAGGQAYAAAFIGTSPRPRRDRAVVAAKALAQLGLTPLLAAVAVLRGGPAGPGLATRLAGAAGKLSWRRLYPLYREEERRYAPARSWPAATRIAVSTTAR